MSISNTSSKFVPPAYLWSVYTGLEPQSGHPRIEPRRLVKIRDATFRYSKQPPHPDTRAGREHPRGDHRSSCSSEKICVFRQKEWREAERMADIWPITLKIRHKLGNHRPTGAPDPLPFVYPAVEKLHLQRLRPGDTCLGPNPLFEEVFPRTVNPEKAQNPAEILRKKQEGRKHSKQSFLQRQEEKAETWGPPAASGRLWKAPGWFTPKKRGRGFFFWWRHYKHF